MQHTPWSRLGPQAATALYLMRQLVHELSALLDKPSFVTRDDIALVLRKFEAEMIAHTTPAVLGSRSALNAMHASNPIDSHGAVWALTAGALYGAACLARRAQIVTNCVNYFCDMKK